MPSLLPLYLTALYSDTHMPARNATKQPLQIIDQACRRHLNGEPAEALATEYGISKAGFYVWVRQYKQRILAKPAALASTPEARLETLAVEVAALKEENRQLRNKVISLMLKAGEM